MTVPHDSSRREFLTSSVKLAAAAGLATAAGCAATGRRGPVIAVSGGPEPRKIGSEDIIRFGLIGIGGRGQGLLDVLLKQKNIAIKALADVDPNNQKAVVEKVRKATGQTIDVYGEPEDYKNRLLARDDIDAVLSATPCYLHGPVYLACFAAGKHFYGEKPMCIEANEADALVEAQKKNPRVVGQIGFQRRASKLYAEGIKRIREGEFGELIDGRAAWNNDWGPIGRPNEGARIWLGRRKLSGDWMLEQACHSWDVIGWITGDMPVAASGIGRRDVFKDMDPQRDVTDYYVAHLQYKSGLVVDFEHSWICPHKDKGQFTGVYERFAGKKGGITFGDGWMYWRDVAREPEQIKVDDGDHTVRAIESFLDAIRTGAPNVCTVESSRLATYTGLLVRKAVDERRWVRIEELL